MKKIAMLKICDYDDIDNSEYLYWVEKNEDFDEKLEKFREIVANYSEFEEVEKFIAENFVEVDCDEYEIYYYSIGSEDFDEDFDED